MKAELNKVRQTYSVKYQEFISSIKANADEVFKILKMTLLLLSIYNVVTRS